MAGNNNQLMGRAQIRANGAVLMTLDGATFTPSGVTRTVVKGYDVYGYQEAVQEAHLECKLQQAPGGTSVDDVNNMNNVTVSFTADTGENWTIANAWCDGGCTLDDKGSIDAKFTGKKSQRTA
ncbi:phage tail protein [Salmonella enterica]|nr:phage tail protein [Salmonella enterica]EHH5781162.1 phage tail protein [Salmonella enterica]ELE3234340.1 phage tail tube protein [Salmonella enterica subsp. enterica serovar Pomona]ELZ0794987.1 phage tail tube protein [Salmonella enterica]